MLPDRLEVVDSHTEGEPTRVLVEPLDLPGATLAERLACLRRDRDALRTRLVLEPRGHEAMVGAVLTPPVSAGAVAGVIFFNNAGYLGMCGHGLIGVVRTLAHLERIDAGRVTLDTPVGRVAACLEGDGAVTIENVPARLHRKDVDVEVPGLGSVRGDVAWGGNWFFLTRLDAPPLELSRLRELTAATLAIRDALAAAGVTGSDGAYVDHVELFGPARRGDADSRNFVLCPGGAYDRSPCGTGTSAKLAALHARGELTPGDVWRQESITGSRFEAWLVERDGVLVPHVRGRAWVTARSTLLFDDGDPFRDGLR